MDMHLTELMNPATGSTNMGVAGDNGNDTPGKVPQMPDTGKPEVEKPDIHEVPESPQPEVEKTNIEEVPDTQIEEVPGMDTEEIPVPETKE